MKAIIFTMFAIYYVIMIVLILERSEFKMNKPSTWAPNVAILSIVYAVIMVYIFLT